METNLLFNEKKRIAYLKNKVLHLCESRRSFKQRCDSIKEQVVESPTIVPSYRCTSVDAINRMIKETLVELRRCLQDQVDQKIRFDVIEGQDSTDCDTDSPPTTLRKWYLEVKALCDAHKDVGVADSCDTTTAMNPLYEKTGDEETLRFVVLHKGHVVSVVVSQTDNRLTVSTSPYVDGMEVLVSQSTLEPDLSSLMSCVTDHLDSNVIPFS